MSSGFFSFLWKWDMLVVSLRQYIFSGSRSSQRHFSLYLATIVWPANVRNQTQNVLCGRWTWNSPPTTGPPCGGCVEWFWVQVLAEYWLIFSPSSFFFSNFTLSSSSILSFLFSVWCHFFSTQSFFSSNHCKLNCVQSVNWINCSKAF